MWNWKPRQKPLHFNEKQIRTKAYELWTQRGSESSTEENWQDAMQSLERERLLAYLLLPARVIGKDAGKIWRWTGISEKKGVELVQLLAGISIPVLLFLATQYFNGQQRQLADNKTKQETWVKYLDQMAGSLEDGLLDAKPGSKEFLIAQAMTVTALQSLDKKRQGLLIQYLTAAGLNHASEDLKKDKDGNVLLRTGDRVLLYRALMAKVDLKNSDLSGSVLIGANLRNTRELSQLELEGETHPLLCNVVLPEEIKVDRNRDCDRLSQALVAKFPQHYSSIEDAKKYVDEARQKQWE